MAGEGGTIVDAETFEHVTELETRQAARLRYAVSVLTMHAGPGSYEATGFHAVAQQFADTIRNVIRNTDLLQIVPAGSTIRILLVGCDLEDLARIIERIIAAVGPWDSERGPQRGRFALSFGAGAFPATTTNSLELVRQADTLADEARRGQSLDSRYRLPRRYERSA